MANYCGGRWRSSSSIPNSRCPSLSQLQGIDFEQLFGNIQGSTEPAPFVDHVGHLLPDIPQAQSTQYVRPNRSEPPAFVEYMIQRGDEALYKADPDEMAKEKRYGIIGVGMMGREHMMNLAHLEGATVVCVADPHLPSQQAAVDLAAAHHWTLEVFSSHHELLDSGLCDVVVVSTPNMTHFQILMDIISHPKPHHVLVEKPLCTKVEDCQKVIAAAKKRPGILVQVGLEYRYMPPIARLIKEVKHGVLGRVRMVAIREHRFPFLVKVDNWNRFNVNTGGTLVEKCCHFFDLMNLIVAANPVRVMASGSQDVNHKDEEYNGKVPDILDNAFVIVEYDNGSRAMLDLCMFAEGSKNEQEVSVVGDIGKGEAFVPENTVRIGTRANGRAGVQTVQIHDERVKYEGLHHGSSYLEHLNFLASVTHGNQSSDVSLQEGLLSVAIGVAAQLSIEMGRFITIKEVLEEKGC